MGITMAINGYNYGNNYKPWGCRPRLSVIPITDLVELHTFLTVIITTYQSPTMVA